MKKKFLFLIILLTVLFIPHVVKAEELSTPTNVRWKEGETPIVTWNPVTGANYYLVDLQRVNMENMTYHDNYYQYYVSTNEVDISTSLIANGYTGPYRVRVKAIYVDDNKQIESEFSEFGESFSSAWTSPYQRDITDVSIDDDYKLKWKDENENGYIKITYKANRGQEYSKCIEYKNLEKINGFFVYDARKDLDEYYERNAISSYGYNKGDELNISIGIRPHETKKGIFGDYVSLYRGTEKKVTTSYIGRDTIIEYNYPTIDENFNVRWPVNLVDTEYCSLGLLISMPNENNTSNNSIQYNEIIYTKGLTIEDGYYVKNIRKTLEHEYNRFPNNNTVEVNIYMGPYTNSGRSLCPGYRRGTYYNPKGNTLAEFRGFSNEFITPRISDSDTYVPQYYYTALAVGKTMNPGIKVLPENAYYYKNWYASSATVGSQVRLDNENIIGQGKGVKDVNIHINDKYIILKVYVYEVTTDTVDDYIKSNIEYKIQQLLYGQTTPSDIKIDINNVQILMKSLIESGKSFELDYDIYETTSTISGYSKYKTYKSYDIGLGLYCRDDNNERLRLFRTNDIGKKVTQEIQLPDIEGAEYIILRKYKENGEDKYEELNTTIKDNKIRFEADGNGEYVLMYKKGAGVSYTTHVQNIGWQDYVSNGAMAGTSGKSLRLEGIKIKLTNKEYSGNILYRTHIQNIGWEKEFKKNDEVSGTSGKSLRLEAIEIKLDGVMSKNYDVYYRVHAENFGWLGWAKNGESAGTAGYAYRLEGIEIRLIPKGQEFSEYGEKVAFKDKNADKLISYTTHVQNIGWQDYVSDGTMAGTSGKALRLEGIKIKLENQKYDGNVLYRTHIQNIGWEKAFKKNNEMSGTSGRSLRLEAIEIKLDGGMRERYDVYYRVHAENFGWLGWAKNGESAGTAGYGFRLEGIEIKLVKKGQDFPDYGKTKAFREKK